MQIVALTHRMVQRFQAVSNINSDNEMAKAAVDIDSAAYFNELLKDET